MPQTTCKSSDKSSTGHNPNTPDFFNNLYSGIWKTDGYTQTYKYEDSSRVEFYKRLANLPIFDGTGKILDVGCGMGGVFSALSQNNQLIKYGIDFSPVAIEKVQQRFPDGIFVTGDVHLLPFPDNFFERIICTETLEHVDDPAAVVAEIFRVLKWNGKLLITVPEESLDLKDEDWPGGKSLHPNKFSIQSLVTLTESKGFRIESTKIDDKNIWLTAGKMASTCKFRRVRSQFNLTSIDEDIKTARTLFREEKYLDAFDLYEHLANHFQGHAVPILAEAHDLFKLLPNKDNRYHLYQARYFDFGIQPSDKVLDIGSGHLPFPLATHLADLDLGNGNIGRAGIPFKHLDGKPVFLCNIEDMPFDDKQFDFIYCSHVLEHVSDPERACKELMRVAKRGYIESPTRGKDMFFNNAKKSNHRWAIEAFQDVLIFSEYSPHEVEAIQSDVLANMHLSPQSDREKAVSALIYLKAELMNTMFFWEERFSFEIRRQEGTLVRSYRKDHERQASDHTVKNLETNMTFKCMKSHQNDLPRLSFVTIVLNGMPFIEPCIKAIYDSAYEIIIVEGAVKNCLFAANQDGSSKDGTVEFIKSFPDPENKIKFLQGIWPEKCEMQNKALEYITGDYVWLVDSDEIYRRGDLEHIRKILASDPSITQVNFIPDNFWKGFDNIFVSPKFFEQIYHYRRVFKFVPGSRFTTHRPPTLVWPGATESTEQMKLVDGFTTRAMGLIPCHYSYVFDSQVEQKIELYRRYGWGDGWGIDLEKWYREFFQRWTPENSRDLERLFPIWTGDPHSYSVPFTGIHPEVVQEFMAQNPSQSMAGSCARLRIAGEDAEGKDLTQIQEGSEFETRLRELIISARPRSIIETGTYLGKGTTRIIAESLRDAGLSDTVFFTIECNPDHHRQARLNLAQAGLLPRVNALLGLSVPRALLPSREKILEQTVKNLEGDGIFVDHKEHERVALYHRETDFPGIPDNLLGACLGETGYRPDIVLLDSAGHMGNVEFNYLIERLRGECIVVLDDIRHIKHHASFKQLQTDRRFSLVTASDEKFGFCIARFTPETKPAANLKRILWIRTDSIGDNILAMSMLSPLRETYPNAEITVLCQEHIVELYEACPLVNRVIGFKRLKALQDDAYRTEILETIQAVGADLALNTVFSREPLTDLFTAASGARQRIALEGNLCNISAADREHNNRLYTSVLPSEGEDKNELERHRDFLRGIGASSARLNLSFWVTPDDVGFADRLFHEHGLAPEKTVALFAGAQHGVRLYDHYGTALANICQANDFAVLALGAAGDHQINQQNLDAIGTRTVNLSGALTLRQSAALLSRCRLAVGAETGLAHMACAVETPNVILLGGGHFGRFMPYSPLTSIVALPLECHGCNWQCRYQRVHCVRDVAPSAIEEAVRRTLAEPSDKPRFFAVDKSAWQSGTGEPGWGTVREFIPPGAVTIIPVS